MNVAEHGPRTMAGCCACSSKDMAVVLAYTTGWIRCRTDISAVMRGRMKGNKEITAIKGADGKWHARTRLLLACGVASRPCPTQTALPSKQSLTCRLFSLFALSKFVLWLKSKI